MSAMDPAMDPAMDQAELHAWLRLLLTPGLGLTQARRLLGALGSPQAIWAASPSVWGDILGARDTSAWALPPDTLAEQGERTAAWAELDGRHILSLADPRYPRALLEATDPPLLLFAEGDLASFDAPAVAMVGSRHATVQGAENARAFAQALAEAGVVVISGLARGIDAASHEGALVAGEALGRPCTIAVVGTGLDQVYPKGHTALARRIAQRGLVLSEFALGAPPLAQHFPRRNRIVAALSRATLVVEAAVQSGSLITARLAADMGREVLAIPGSIHAPQSRGCHALIKQGAKLVETAQDVLEELGPGLLGLSAAALAGMSGKKAGAHGANDAHGEEGGALAEAGADMDTSDAADPVLRAMGYDPVSQEALSARTGWGPADLGAHLLTLELMGQVARLPGALFQRVGRA
jgi:DNA processing protein